MTVLESSAVCLIFMSQTPNCWFEGSWASLKNRYKIASYLTYAVSLKCQRVNITQSFHPVHHFSSVPLSFCLLLSHLPVKVQHETHCLVSDRQFCNLQEVQIYFLLPSMWVIMPIFSNGHKENHASILWYKEHYLYKKTGKYSGTISSGC